MPLYDDTFSELSPDEQRQIKNKIALWSTAHPYGHKVSRNILAEHFLEKPSMKEILKFIAKRDFSVVEVFEGDYNDVCHQHSRKGGPVEWSRRPLIFGTAIEKVVFIDYLMRQYPYKFRDVRTAEDFITYLKKGTLAADDEDILLKEYSIWTTWNQEEYTHGPFDFSRTEDADEIRANLGLDKELHGEELLLFVYRLPPDLKVMRPTIADAGLSQFFEPTVEGLDQHGFTVAWPKEPAISHYRLDGRPEGVHERVPLACVVPPITIRK